MESLPQSAAAGESGSRPLGHRTILGYAVGDLGINLNFQLIGFYLAYFYTDVFGLSASHVAGLFLVARMWDAVMDPIMGYIADHTRTRWGRFRPYVLFGALPLNAALVACFATPDLPYSAKVVYAGITYILHGMAFTAVGLPYSSISAAMTQNPQERAVVSTYRMFFAVIVALSVVSIGVRPLVGHFANERIGFMAVAVIFAVVSTALLWISFARSKESVVAPPETYRVRDVLRIIARNDALLILSLAMFLNTCVWVVGSSVALYFFKYIVGNADLQASFFFWMLPANVAGVLVTPILTRRIGKLQTFVLGSALVALFSAIRHFVPVPLLATLIGVSMVATFGQMLCSITQWGMLPDTVEYGEFRTGIRSEGITFAIFSFTQKLGMAVGGALAALFLARSGYTPNAAQSASALQSIAWLFNLVPAAFSLACLAALMFYRLDAARFAQIRQVLATRATGKACG